MRSIQANCAEKRIATVLVLIVLLMPVVLAVAAYAINIAYMELVRTELQICTDIATRAAGRTLAVTGSEDEAISAAQQLARLNPVVNLPVRLTKDDLVFGVSTRESESARYLFQPGKNPNAVKLRTDSFAASNTPVLFPSMGLPVQFRPVKSAISTQAELDLALVLDRSGSMVFTAAEPSQSVFPMGWSPGLPVPLNSRWIDTVVSVDLLLQQLVTSCLSERVALASYSSTATFDVKLTDQYSSIYEQLIAFSQQFEGGATNIGDGIVAGINALNEKKTARSWASRVIILMSDGNHNTGLDPLQAAQLAASQHITIYTISFSDEANQELMSQIATTCCGTHYHASSREQLSLAFQEIASRLPLLVTY